MKKFIPRFILGFGAIFLLTMTLSAQEKTEVTVKVTKDGKVVKDTTYQFDDASEAKHALKMMEMLTDEGEHMMEYNYTMAHKHGDHSKAMVFISEDGKKTEIKEFSGDSLVWISEDGDGDVKVIKKKMGDGDHGEHVVIMKKGDGETFDILIDEDGNKKKVKKKEVRVMVSGDGENVWHAKENEFIHADEDVFVISGDEDVKVELKKILEDHDGENVKVIVVKKDHKCCDHAEGEECEHDHDHEKEVEVEVKTEKKIKKKPKKQ